MTRDIPILTGALDGFAIHFGEQEVCVIPTLTGAARALVWANWSLAELDRVLASQPRERAS